jgi:hypothetical protein
LKEKLFLKSISEGGEQIGKEKKGSTPKGKEDYKEALNQKATIVLNKKSAE